MDAWQHAQMIDAIHDQQDRDRKDCDRPDRDLDLSAAIARLERELALPEWRGPQGPDRRQMQRTLELFRSEVARG